MSVRRTDLRTITRAGTASRSRSARVRARSSPCRSPDHAAINTSTRYRAGIAAAASATWTGDSSRSVTGRDRPTARRGVDAPRTWHGFVARSPSITAVAHRRPEQSVGLRLPGPAVPHRRRTPLPTLGA